MARIECWERKEGGDNNLCLFATNRGDKIAHIAYIENDREMAVMFAHALQHEIHERAVTPEDRNVRIVIAESMSVIMGQEFSGDLSETHKHLSMVKFVEGEGLK